jgi:hypothetical protein
MNACSFQSTLWSLEQHAAYRQSLQTLRLFVDRSGRVGDASSIGDITPVATLPARLLDLIFGRQCRCFAEVTLISNDEKTPGGVIQIGEVRSSLLATLLIRYDGIFI